MAATRVGTVRLAWPRIDGHPGPTLLSNFRARYAARPCPNGVMVRRLYGPPGLTFGMEPVSATVVLGSGATSFTHRGEAGAASSPLSLAASPLIVPWSSLEEKEDDDADDDEVQFSAQV